jgi:hypothetical protein
MLNLGKGVKLGNNGVDVESVKRGFTGE